jgi:molybdate/tungstate transport system permease protein
VSFPWKPGLVGLLLLAALHLVLALSPGPTFSPSTHLALFGSNAYALYCALLVLQRGSGKHLALFVSGYMILFILLMVLLNRSSLFILLLVLYASLFGSPLLLGFFALFVLCFVVLQPYAFESFIPLALIYAALWRARARTSRFVLACLGVGLVALCALLFPLLHLVMQDSAQTLWLALKRSDVQSAIWLSVASSTLATLLIAVWGIPLACALARVDFWGRRVVETVIDIPILIPQSVVGIAFIVLLGPGSPMGEALDQLFGIQIAGRLIGVVLAQVFVAAPFLIKTALTAFQGVPEELELASRTLGASPAQTFWRISLPLASRGLMIGMILAWARAISEFGAVILFASSPLTAPVLVHTEFLRAGATESRPIATLLLIICLWIFVVLQLGPSLAPFAWQRRADRGAR